MTTGRWWMYAAALREGMLQLETDTEHVLWPAYYVGLVYVASMLCRACLCGQHTMQGLPMWPTCWVGLVNVAKYFG